MPEQPIDVGSRVRARRVFQHWKQTPGTVVELDRNFGIALVAFDNGITRWVAGSLIEPAKPKT